MPVAARKATLRYYYRNKEKLDAAVRERRNEHQEIINEFKRQPCVDCGQIYPPYVMDFHHVRGKKSFQIGGSLHLALDKLLREIDKCDIICSNCHRERTFGMKSA